MPCLETMISFENLELVQIYCLANQKILNLNLDQIRLLVFNVVKVENLKMTIQTLLFSNFSFKTS